MSTSLKIYVGACIFFITCDRMPPLLQSLHLVTTSRSADNAIHKKHTHQNQHFVRASSNFTLCSFKINVFLRVFLRTDPKIDVSCEASVDFHHLSQNVTPATEFAPCHHFAQRRQCESQKTRNTTRLKFCACHAK